VPWTVRVLAELRPVAFSFDFSFFQPEGLSIAHQGSARLLKHPEQLCWPVNREEVRTPFGLCLTDALAPLHTALLTQPWRTIALGNPDRELSPVLWWPRSLSICHPPARGGSHGSCIGAGRRRRRFCAGTKAPLFSLSLLFNPVSFPFLSECRARARSHNQVCTQ